MPFYVKSSIPGSEAYHTGEHDRSLPPNPYITEDLSEAAPWDDKFAAEAWAEQFGGEVIELPAPISFEKFGEYMAAKSALNKMADCAMFSGRSVELTREEILALFSQKVIDLEAQRGMIE